MNQLSGLGLPGIDVPGFPATARPETLLAPGSLLLAGARRHRPLTLAEHRDRWRTPDSVDLPTLLALARRHYVVGGGGAAFPTWRKLASLRGRRVGRVVVNGAEGEPASAKDGLLLLHVPHLVLDGAVAAARALGCRRVTVRLSVDRPQVISAVRSALAERTESLRMDLSIGPADFVAGEATAVISSLHSRPAAPTPLGLPPRAPRRLGPRRHVFLSNVETFARLALAVRDDPRRSALFTLSGGVRRPGVLECDPRLRFGDALAVAEPIDDPQVVVTGGWHGRWLPLEQLLATRLDRDGLQQAGGRWGAGVMVVIPGSMPTSLAVGAVARRLAADSAGRCGPCALGLPQLAHRIQGSEGGPDRGLGALLDDISGSGQCAHPTAAVAALRSALQLTAAHQESELIA